MESNNVLFYVLSLQKWSNEPITTQGTSKHFKSTHDKSIIHTTLCINSIITRTTLCMNPISGRDLDNERTISHAKSEAHRSTKSKRTENRKVTFSV